MKHKTGCKVDLMLTSIKHENKHKQNYIVFTMA